MKPGFLLLSIILFFSSTAKTQYTPLPQLDQSAYEEFICLLKTQAAEQQIPELNAVADNMSYEEARRFLLNPHAFADRLRDEQKAEDKPILNAARMGLVLNFLVNYVSNLGSSGTESKLRFGYAFGLYAMFTVGKVYLMTELLYLYRSAKLEYDQYSFSVVQLNYLSLVTTLLYTVNTGSPRWYIGAGPIINFGLFGEEELTLNNQKEEFDLEFGDDGVRRFQFGIAFRTGIIFTNAMRAYLGYNLMLSKVYDGSDWKIQSILLGMNIPFSVFK